jgi:hypothetical protein
MFMNIKYPVDITAKMCGDIYEKKLFHSLVSFPAA